MKDYDIRKKDELHALNRTEKLIRSIFSSNPSLSAALKANIQVFELKDKTPTQFKDEENKEMKEEKSFQKLTKSFTVKMNKSLKNLNSNDEDNHIKQLIENFKAEIIRRRTCLMDLKLKKDKILEEIEHDKTQMKIVENKSERSISNNSLRFPINVDFSLINLRFHQENINKESKYYYQLESDSKSFISEVSHNTNNPSWNDCFPLQLNYNNSISITVLSK